jgi:spore germination protein YaaH/putative cell wall-binding protein
MPLIRRLRLPMLLLVMASLVMPGPATAADPPLGEAVTLADGTVLPPMPAEQAAPTVQWEMLSEHGGIGAASDDGAVSIHSEGAAQAAQPLVVTQGGAIGPAGPLPNGLRREVLGFLPYWKLDSTTRNALRLDLVSTIAYFSIGVQSNGALTKGTSVGWTSWTSAAMTDLMNKAHARGVRVVPTITMMAWNYDYTAMSTLLNSNANRSRLVGEVVAMVRDRSADGVNIDFEPVPSTLRSQFTALVREIKAGLVNAKVGSYVTVDTMAGAATWATGYDVVGLTAPGAADAIMVMAYDFSYAGSGRAGGVAPYESSYMLDARTAMRDHVATVPRSKIVWGIPYYGRAWNTTSNALNSTVRTPPNSVAFVYYGRDGSGTPLGAKVLAERYGRKWDAAGRVPWFVFWDAGSNGYRQGYYDDPTSLRAKYDMVLANGVAGIGIWHLGMDTGVNDLWNVIEDRFSKVQVRLAGEDRYATAARVSAASFSPGVPVAYVATGANFPDALAAGPAATVGGGPVLLTTASSLPSATRAELARVKPQKIYVLGGASAVSNGVLAELRGYATSGQAERLGGADRYTTAAIVSARTFGTNVPVAYVATGASFPDALSGGVAAGRQKGPVLLVSQGSVPTATANELKRLKPGKIHVLGGAGVVNDSVLSQLRSYATSGTVTRLAGADRYATSVAISQATTNTDAPRTVYIATGASFADGLAGTPAAARANGPLIIVPPTGLTTAIANELRRLNPPRIVILGGTGAVSNAIARQIQGLWD